MLRRQFRFRLAMMVLLCLGCVYCSSNASGAAAVAGVSFNPLPSPGANKGSYTVGLTWANCGNNIGSLTVNLWTAKKAKLVDQPTLMATQQNPILPQGTHSWNRTGIASGTVISIAEGIVFDNTPNNAQVIATTGPLDATSFPVPFNGCTIP
ncbi:hypothetical protein R5W23_002606 [Gemmata sp. JC673]|uniref:Uncharacterized protein n=1 Tax=Gemmata algarum TaxID=2975278 RepID=A0ABU5F627_9BACT|nr:hypothetical protein [Gemmata algarum]MDY3561329.1 hypothetical protein [Gemmata algarum]